MNHTATSEDALLRASLKFASQEGLGSLNIRSIARECGVSVGCVYRYFPSKAALISGAVGRIWEDIFRRTESGEDRCDFRACIRWVFACICNGCAEYPSFFRQHAAAFQESEKSDGRQAMDQYLRRIRAMLLQALESDPGVRQDRFDASLTREALVSFVLDNLLALGVRQERSCEFLLCLLEKLLY
jgi:AcrR family transcriptional regulator